MCLNSNGDLLQAVSSKPEIMYGKPVIAGTRIPVDLILEELASGEAFEQIIEAHPKLAEEAIIGALQYAAEVLHSESIYQINEVMAIVEMEPGLTDTQVFGIANEFLNPYCDYTSPTGSFIANPLSCKLI